MDENDDEAQRRAYTERLRARINAELATLPWAPSESDPDEITRANMRMFRGEEVGRRLQRELAPGDVRGGVADMVDFVRCVGNGLVPDAKLLRSIAVRFEDVLADTTSLYDWTCRIGPLRAPPDERLAERAESIRPRTTGEETGRAFLRAFDMARPPGGKRWTVEDDVQCAELDGHYRMLEARSPGIKRFAAFHTIASAYRALAVDDASEKALLERLPKEVEVPDADMADWRQTMRCAHLTVRAMFGGEAAPDAPEDELQRHGWELAHEARRDAESSVPKIDADQVSALIERWRYWDRKRKPGRERQSGTNPPASVPPTTRDDENGAG